MIKKRMLLTILLGAAITAAMPNLAPLYAEGKPGMKMSAAADQDGKDTEKPKQSVKPPATAEGIWEEIHKERMELDEAVKSKKLDSVHLHAFAIRDLAKALAAKAPAKNKAAVKETVKKIAKLAAELDKSGDAGDQVATEVNFKKLDRTLDNLRAQLEKK